MLPPAARTAALQGRGRGLPGAAAAGEGGAAQPSVCRFCLCSTPSHAWAGGKGQATAKVVRQKRDRRKARPPQRRTFTGLGGRERVRVGDGRGQAWQAGPAVGPRNGRRWAGTQGRARCWPVSHGLSGRPSHPAKGPCPSPPRGEGPEGPNLETVPQLAGRPSPGPH